MQYLPKPRKNGLQYTAEQYTENQYKNHFCIHTVFPSVLSLLKHKHCFYKMQSFFHPFYTEKHPTAYHCHRCIQMIEEFHRIFFQYFSTSQTLCHHKKSMEQSPENKVPAGAVPQSCQKKDNTQIYISSECSFSISSQWNIYILFKPGRQ